MPETLCANKFEYWGHSNEIRNARATSKSFRKISFNLDASLKFNVFIKLYEEVSPLALKESETLEMTKIMSNDVASLKEEMMKLKKIATVKLECPVCYEELKPPMRLKQCAQVFADFYNFYILFSNGFDWYMWMWHSPHFIESKLKWVLSLSNQTNTMPAIKTLKWLQGRLPLSSFWPVLYI